MSSFSTEPPAPDVFEVSLFGPGKGESVVVHLGARRWIVVDSCRNQRTRVAAALDYLRGIGADLTTEVLTVVATHAHDDHFDGIAEVVEACPAATIVTSHALMNREFFALVEAERDIAGITNTAAYREYRRIFEIIEQRRKSTGKMPGRLAEENKVLLNLPASGEAPPVKVTALSPSEYGVVRAREALAKDQLFRLGERTRRSVYDPNEASVALWVSSGTVNVLLGADILKGPAGCGWGAVLESSFSPPEPATLYKAAHHGSKTSHHDGLWSDLLGDGPTVLIAPFRLGSISVPSGDEAAYFTDRTAEVFITSPRSPTPSKAFKREVAKLGSLAKNARDPYGIIGHLRARVPLAGGAWQVEKFGPAAQLGISK
ncbi:MBL fold metallo-hydrolase [Streptomyces sp. NPDC102487]|uniref:MBL fold metallo-hydrolase n=1 Tax=Streptomyces sp. NPDC102487 TaxID=3366182 RepID=UPI00382C8E26